jgi:hypothetical protein
MKNSGNNKIGEISNKSGIITGHWHVAARKPVNSNRHPHEEHVKPHTN